MGHFRNSGAVFSGTVGEGEALAVPAGFMFTDVSGELGNSGLKLSRVHASRVGSLKRYNEQLSFFTQSSQEDVVVKHIVED